MIAPIRTSLSRIARLDRFSIESLPRARWAEGDYVIGEVTALPGSGVGIELADEVTRDTARQRYVEHLDKEASLVAATKWLADEKLEHEAFHPQIQKALEQATKPLTRGAAT